MEDQEKENGSVDIETPNSAAVSREASIGKSSTSKGEFTSKSSVIETSSLKEQNSPQMRSLQSLRKEKSGSEKLGSKSFSQDQLKKEAAKPKPKKDTTHKPIKDQQTQHFRELVGQRELKNVELEKRQGDLRQRLDVLECSMPAVMVWNIWRMAQGTPVSRLHRVLEKQFQGPASGEVFCPNTPSRHYDCRVREVEAERKLAQKRVDEARVLWAEKVAALAERKRKLEEARKIQEEREEKIKELTNEAQQLRESRTEEVNDPCNCGDQCKPWLKASTSSIGSADVERLEKLQDLAEAELAMKRQIADLERREDAYMRTLQQADELWAKAEGDNASTVSALQEQLDLKTAANQQLADRTCQLEDDLEKLRSRMANCRAELEKFLSITKIEAAIGRDDDDAGVADKASAARVRVEHRKTGGEGATVAERGVNARGQTADKGSSAGKKVTDQETLAGVDLMDEGVHAVLESREATASAAPEMAEAATYLGADGIPADVREFGIVDPRLKEVSEYLAQLGSLDELYKDDGYVCPPDFTCGNQVFTESGLDEEELAALGVNADDVRKILSGQQGPQRNDGPLEVGYRNIQKTVPSKGSGGRVRQDRAREIEEEFQKGAEDLLSEGGSLPGLEDGFELRVKGGEEPGIVEDANVRKPTPKREPEDVKRVQSDTQNFLVSRNELLSWLDDLSQVRLTIANCEDCRPMLKTANSLAEKIANYTGTKLEPLPEDNIRPRKREVAPISEHVKEESSQEKIKPAMAKDEPKEPERTKVESRTPDESQLAESKTRDQSKMEIESKPAAIDGPIAEEKPTPSAKTSRIELPPSAAEKIQREPEEKGLKKAEAPEEVEDVKTDVEHLEQPSERPIAAGVGELDQADKDVPLPPGRVEMEAKDQEVISGKVIRENDPESAPADEVDKKAEEVELRMDRAEETHAGKVEETRKDEEEVAKKVIVTDKVSIIRPKVGAQLHPTGTEDAGVDEKIVKIEAEQKVLVEEGGRVEVKEDSEGIIPGKVEEKDGLEEAGGRGPKKDPDEVILAKLEEKASSREEIEERVTKTDTEERTLTQIEEKAPLKEEMEESPSKKASEEATLTKIEDKARSKEEIEERLSKKASEEATLTKIEEKAPSKEEIERVSKKDSEEATLIKIEEKAPLEEETERPVPKEHSQLSLQAKVEETSPSKEQIESAKIKDEPKEPAEEKGWEDLPPPSELSAPETIQPEMEPEKIPEPGTAIEKPIAADKEPEVPPLQKFEPAESVIDPRLIATPYLSVANIEEPGGPAPLCLCTSVTTPPLALSISQLPKPSEDVKPEVVKPEVVKPEVVKPELPRPVPVETQTAASVGTQTQPAQRIVKRIESLRFEAKRPEVQRPPYWMAEASRLKEYRAPFGADLQSEAISRLAETELRSINYARKSGESQRTRCCCCVCGKAPRSARETFRIAKSGPKDFSLPQERLCPDCRARRQARKPCDGGCPDDEFPKCLQKRVVEKREQGCMAKIRRQKIGSEGKKEVDLRSKNERVPVPEAETDSLEGCICYETTGTKRKLNCSCGSG